MEHISLAYMFKKFANDPLFDGYLWTHGLLSYFLGVIQLVGLAWILLKSRKKFLTWRSEILVAHIMFVMLTQDILVLNTPMVYSLHPLEIPNGTWKQLQYHFLFPMCLARASLGFSFPLHLRHFLYLANMGLYTRFNMQRCPQEIASMAGQGQWYHNIVIAVETAFYKWFPFPAFRRQPGGALLTEGLSELGSCLVFKEWTQVSWITHHRYIHINVNARQYSNFMRRPMCYKNARVLKNEFTVTLNKLTRISLYFLMQIVLGYLLPIAIMGADEIVSRKAFEKKRNLSTAFVHKQVMLVLHHLLLVPLGAALVFHAAVFVISYLNI